MGNSDMSQQSCGTGFHDMRDVKIGEGTADSGAAHDNTTWGRWWSENKLCMLEYCRFKITPMWHPDPVYTDLSSNLCGCHALGIRVQGGQKARTYMSAHMHNKVKNDGID